MCADSGKGVRMADRARTQTLSCAVVVALALGFTVLSRLASLAVERWGAIAFVLILVAMVAAAFGLVATGWVRRKGEGMWMVLVLMSAITVSNLAWTLGVPWLASGLIGTFITIAGLLVFLRFFRFEEQGVRRTERWPEE